jgi:hypothetical protein
MILLPIIIRSFAFGIGDGPDGDEEKNPSSRPTFLPLEQQKQQPAERSQKSSNKVVPSEHSEFEKNISAAKDKMPSMSQNDPTRQRGRNHQQQTNNWRED